MFRLISVKWQNQYPKFSNLATESILLINILHVLSLGPLESDLSTISYLAPVLDSMGCHNKSLQTWWFKTTEMSSLTVLVARSPRGWQSHTASHGSRVASVPHPFSFWWLQEFFSLWLPYSNIFLHLSWPPLSLFPSVCLL